MHKNVPHIRATHMYWLNALHIFESVFIGHLIRTMKKLPLLESFDVARTIYDLKIERLLDVLNMLMQK